MSSGIPHVLTLVGSASGALLILVLGWEIASRFSERAGEPDVKESSPMDVWDSFQAAGHQPPLRAEESTPDGGQVENPWKALMQRQSGENPKPLREIALESDSGDEEDAS